MRKFALFALLMLLVFGAVSAQETSPLLEILSLVPNTAATREDLIYYTDLEALGTAYGAEKPASTAELTAAREEGGNIQHAAWWAILRNSSMPGSMAQTWSVDDPSMPLGFGYVQVDRGIAYGTPPANALILEGDFDESAVHGALAERDYVEIDDSALWCPGGDCTSGENTNLDNRESNNPFGGNFGRQQPIVVEDNRLMSSANLDVVNDYQAVVAGEADSLADVPAYIAAVEAVTQEGTLLQALIVDQPIVSSLVDFGQVLMLDRDEMAAFLEMTLENYQTLPAFNLLLLADTVTETDQVVHLALVYPNEADAQTAIEVLPARIENYQSLQMRRPMTEIIEERGAVLQEPTLYIASNGQSVVLLTLSTPRAASLEELIDSTLITLDPDDRPDVTAPGILYRTFITMIFARDLGWLSTVPREDLEAMLNELSGS